MSASKTTKADQRNAAEDQAPVGRPRGLTVRTAIIIAGVVFASLGVLAGIALFLLWRASQVVPDFYAEALQVGPSEQQEASDKMIQKATVLASDVQKPGRWEALFTEEEVNGWLAVDLKENHGNSLPPEIADPRVVIKSDELRLACRARRGNLETVLSVAFDAYLVEPSVLGVRIRRVRAGIVPLPLADVLEQIRELGDQQALRIQWQQAEGDPVALIQLTPVVDGDKPVVIDTLELADGEIYVAGTTEEPREDGERPEGASSSSAEITPELTDES